MYEFLTIAAILLGPVLGIWANGQLEERKRKHERKLAIFKALMGARASPLSADYVRALNGIDLEFRYLDLKERPIVDAWRELNAHFGRGPTAPVVPDDASSNAGIEKYKDEFRAYSSQLEIWSREIADRQVNLYDAMAKYFGYSFNRVDLAGTTAYRPTAHVNVEALQQRLLEAATEVFEGRQRIWVQNFVDDEQARGQAELAEAIKASVDPERVVRVKLEREDVNG